MSIQHCPDCGAKFVNGKWETALGKVGNPNQLASRACYYAGKKGLTNCINSAKYKDEEAFNPPTIRNFEEYERMADSIQNYLTFIHNRLNLK